MSNCNKSSLVIRRLLASASERCNPTFVSGIRDRTVTSDTCAKGVRCLLSSRRCYVSTNTVAVDQSPPSVHRGVGGKNNNNNIQYVSPFAELFKSIDMNALSSIEALADIGNLNNTEYTPSIRRILKCGIPEDVLRFSSMTYGRTLQAPTVHANEHRVVLKINTLHLPLSDIEMNILREIVGNDRLNMERSELRLTSNQFGSRIENKRHLVSMLDRMILSCQRLGLELQKDMDRQKDEANVVA